MIISEMKYKTLKACLRGDGVQIEIGPFSVALRSRLDNVARYIDLLYGDYRGEPDPQFCDFHISIEKPTGMRRWIRPQATFAIDGFAPFKPLPYSQAFALFEWGLNWCIATQAHQYLIVHAAVVAREDQAIILPGSPGSGKSTLCAALVQSGWRLLSDEMALIDPDTLQIIPIPRPISLKNESIPLIQALSNDAIIGPTAKDTAKGTVAHMRPPDDSIAHSMRRAHPVHIIFPKYEASAEPQLDRRNEAFTLTDMVENAFNFHILGTPGFKTLERLVTRCPAYGFSYSKLEEGVEAMNELIAER
jgi:HprK-related kinase A